MNIRWRNVIKAIRVMSKNPCKPFLLSCDIIPSVINLYREGFFSEGRF